ncbi:5'-nucleotidase [Rhodovastum atsumiense]|uniref:HAD hydrolase-like protein n=1 Tax=Rhodovastum atsumiense TaxID=504468 RepID=A0A5M6IZC4_9PROT|nr:HAD hydrolase-like protein [Rhodovastum atsumiense]KAA5613309.1 HAD hydrolase-like protein [Rhodovastum atsumiense]CAH2600516.1 5'-nucleotidase [Rhodovastum atsumiense]
MSAAPVMLIDLDGTLTDSRPGIIDCLRRTLRLFGHEPDPADDLSWVIGPPMEQTIGRILAPYGDTREAEATATYRRLYAEGGMFDNSVYAGIPEALDAFTAAGWTLYVATAKRTRFARPILEHFGLARYFQEIHGSEDGPRLDTKPELLAHIRACHGFDPVRAVMIGDRHHDIQGAHANGIRAIGVAWGYGGRAELEEAGADAMAEHPGDLIALAGALLK